MRQRTTVASEAFVLCYSGQLLPGLPEALVRETCRPLI
jgi:hypothetical protein